MEDRIVLFGTGEDLKKCLGILRELGIKPYCFTDNDCSKWDTMIDGKRIAAPSELARMGCRILISSSDYKEQIMNQLREMGLEDRILQWQPFFKEYIDKHINESGGYKSVICDRESVLVDAFMGQGWDGDSMFACCMASRLNERGYDTYVYARESLLRQWEDTEKLIGRFRWERESYWDTVLPIMKDMEQRLPFVLIANSLEYVMAAAYVLKQKYPDKVRIVSVIHNDNYSLYEKHAMWQHSLDKILCVSKRIQKRLEKEWHIPKEKIYYKINPVLWDPCEDLQGVERDRRWDLADAPIRIGWGGRLTASQKRADLLPVLIEELEREGIDYCLEIAGDGSSYSMIKEYLEKNGLENRVHLLGRLESGSMKAFWKHQQIYINLSEYEGSCLAMLEAMECGVVPVVPEVSGTEDCVFDFETGFRVGIGAVKEIVEKIKYLSEHSDMGKYMSQKAMQLVKECCNLDSYMDFIETFIA